MFSCDIHIIAQGQVQQTDPIIIILPEIYRPYLIHRIKGYGANPDWIVRPDGIVQTSGGIGENKANNEIGYSYSVKMI